MSDRPTPNGGIRASLRGYSSIVFVSAFALVLTLAAVASALLVGSPQPSASSVPDLPPRPALTRTLELSDDKRRFIDSLYPIVRAENQRVLELRRHLYRLLARLEQGGALSDGDREWLHDMARRYRAKAETPLEQARALSDRVDIIPAPLALAQAALESAWGQSRFAREANNLFGQWCFEPGCGVVPKRRPAGRTYEVEAFDNIDAAVRSYLQNLNSHPAYAELRRIRAEARAAGRQPEGYAMAAGLSKYAAIGDKYVEHIRGVIDRNGLRAAAD